MLVYLLRTGGKPPKLIVFCRKHGTRCLAAKFVSSFQSCNKIRGLFRCSIVMKNVNVGINALGNYISLNIVFPLTIISLANENAECTRNRSHSDSKEMLTCSLKTGSPFMECYAHKNIYNQGQQIKMHW